MSEKKAAKCPRCGADSQVIGEDEDGGFTPARLVAHCENCSWDFVFEPDAWS